MRRVGVRAAGLGRGLGLALGLLLILLASISGLLPTLLALVLAWGVFWGLIVRFWAWWQGWPRPRLFGANAHGPGHSLHLQALNRVLFWSAAGLTLLLSMPRDLLTPEESRQAWIVLTGMTLANVLMSFRPVVATVRRGANVLPMAVWLFLAIEWIRLLAGPSGPTVTLDPPFDGTWAVVQGGRSTLLNHHYPIPGQRHALDLIRLENGRASEGDAGLLESYFAFGAPLRAPADGKIERAVDGHPDMPIGQTDIDSLVGNHVVIEIGPGRYVLLAHLQLGSVAVSEGQTVRAGELVGRCGNSGNTSQPHLHLQVQSHPDFQAVDLQTFPITFSQGALQRGGRPVSGPPRRNDRVVVPRRDSPQPADRELGEHPGELGSDRG